MNQSEELGKYYGWGVEVLDPFGGKLWSSFHCVVKQQAGAVDACIIEQAWLILLDIFQKNVSENGRCGLIWNKRERSFALSNKLVPLMHA